MTLNRFLLEKTNKSTILYVPTYFSLTYKNGDINRFKIHEYSFEKVRKYLQHFYLNISFCLATNEVR